MTQIKLITTDKISEDQSHLRNQRSIPPHWAWVKLGDVCEILDNKRIPINSGERDKRISGKTIESLFPYYGATGQVGYIDDYLLDGEYVLLGEDGAPFLEKNKPKAYIVNGKIWVNNHAHILLSKNNNRFLCYYLNFLDYHPFVTGTTRLKLNQSSMKQIPIINPPLQEQKKIVDKIEELFSGLDSGVASLKKAKEQLRLYRQSVLAYAFSGRLCKNLINQIPTKDNLPEGWKWVKLGELIKVSSGKGLTSEKMLSDGKYSVYGGNGVSGFYNEYLFEEQRLIIGRVGAKCGVMHITKLKSWVTDNALIVDFLSNKVNMKFLYHCLGYHNLNKLSVSTAQPVISGAKIYPYEILLPTLAQQTQIVEEIEKRFSEADNLEKAIDDSLTKAELLRQSILKNAFEGKL